MLRDVRFAQTFCSFHEIRAKISVEASRPIHISFLCLSLRGLCHWPGDVDSQLSGMCVHHTTAQGEDGIGWLVIATGDEWCLDANRDERTRGDITIGNPARLCDKVFRTRRSHQSRELAVNDEAGAAIMLHTHQDEGRCCL